MKKFLLVAALFFFSEYVCTVTIETDDKSRR